MGPKTMESIPPSKRNTQADIQLRTRQTNHQQETDGCIQIKHNPKHQPSRMSSKSTAYVPPKTASTPTKANTQTCSYLDFNVLKPVPQHPLEPELDFKRGLWNRYFQGGHAMSMRSIDPGRRRRSRGEEQPPWWGLGRSPRSQR